jgi:hypothetical protein
MDDDWHKNQPIDRVFSVTVSSSADNIPLIDLEPAAFDFIYFISVIYCL